MANADPPGDEHESHMNFWNMSFFVVYLCFLFICLSHEKEEQQTEGWKSKDLKVSLARKEFSYICTCAYMRSGSWRFLSSQVLTRGCWSHQDL